LLSLNNTVWHGMRFGRVATRARAKEITPLLSRGLARLVQAWWSWTRGEKISNSSMATSAFERARAKRPLLEGITTSDAATSARQVSDASQNSLPRTHRVRMVCVESAPSAPEWLWFGEWPRQLVELRRLGSSSKYPLGMRLCKSMAKKCPLAVSFKSTRKFLVHCVPRVVVLRKILFSPLENRF
jgi:hypothetical protein